MHLRRARSVPTWLEALVILGLLLALVAAYIAAMQLVIDVSRPGEDPDRRDLVYLYLHLGFLFGGATVGFAAGKFLNGLGFATATLVVVVLAGSMVIAHLTSRAITCGSEAEFLRHWTC